MKNHLTVFDYRNKENHNKNLAKQITDLKAKQEKITSELEKEASSFEISITDHATLRFIQRRMGINPTDMMKELIPHEELLYAIKGAEGKNEPVPITIGEWVYIVNPHAGVLVTMYHKKEHSKRQKQQANKIIANAFETAKNAAVIAGSE